VTLSQFCGFKHEEARHSSKLSAAPQDVG